LKKNSNPTAKLRNLNAGMWARNDVIYEIIFQHKTSETFSQGLVRSVRGLGVMYF